MKTRRLIVLTAFAAITGAAAQESSPPDSKTPPTNEEEAFRLVRRPGSVDLKATYNLDGLTIPEEEIHTLLPRDAIPALTDPKRQPLTEASWLPDSARVILVEVKNEALAVPLRVLNWHEIVNTTVGGEPIAATYCPLCDSATLFSRRLPRTDDAEPVTLEFGVSGALYNSNVLMYDTTHKALWSQLAMRAVSGPSAGTALKILPIKLVTVAQLKGTHPTIEVVADETGHGRDYAVDPYERYFSSERLMVPVREVGDALPAKTLGVGIATGTRAWFVPADTIADHPTVSTPAGDVTLDRTDAGVVVTSAPEGVRTAQAFYYSWSAFYPETEVVGSP